MPIPTADSIFADTNVWVNAVVATSPRHAQAVAALGRMAAGTLWTSRQVVREFLAVMSRPRTFFAGNAPMSDIVDRAHTIESRCRVAEEGPDVAHQLNALLAEGDTRGKQIHDANIVATMLAHGIRTLLTDNVADFARWGHLIDVRAL
jgi:predicted nucleic acid-binding protein